MARYFGIPGELRVHNALRRVGIVAAVGEPEQQFKLGPYRLDFAYPLWRVAIEADGWVHTAKGQRLKDRIRDERLEGWGWLTVRIDIDLSDDQLDAKAGDIAVALSKQGAPIDWRAIDRNLRYRHCPNTQIPMPIR